MSTVKSLEFCSDLDMPFNITNRWFTEKTTTNLSATVSLKKVFLSITCLELRREQTEPRLLFIKHRLNVNRQSNYIFGVSQLQQIHARNTLHYIDLTWVFRILKLPTCITCRIPKLKCIFECVQYEIYTSTTVIWRTSICATRAHECNVYVSDDDKQANKWLSSG